jgi:hypothetical protein
MKLKPRREREGEMKLYDVNLDPKKIGQTQRRNLT